jgi:succinoglycan biosynthesis protein ExoV
MKYIYYKDPNGNFGDDLNGWLWPQLFGEEKNIDDIAFIGIGSILFNNHKIISNLDQKKIVFGTGIRPTHEKFIIDDKWDVKFLRGPLSSIYFNNKYEYISDAAYAVRLIEKFNSIKNIKKKHEISLMPYFRSVNYFDWKSICEKLGFNYISPLSENGVEFTLNEISSSKYLITEAMHGAILADALRVPWHRYILTTPITEGPMVSEFKWLDWLSSIELGNINNTFIKFHRKTILHNIIKDITGKLINTEFYFKNKVKDDIYKNLSNIDEFYLSKESILSDIDFKIHNKKLSVDKLINK